MLPNIDYSKLNNMDDLIENLKLDEIAILGNGSSMLECDFKELDTIFTIGVNHIEQLYIPNVLMWVDNSDYRIQNVWEGNASLKICRDDSFARKKANFTFHAPNRISFGHKWRGAIPRTGSYFTAIYIAMLLKPKIIYLVGCDFSENKHFYDYLDSDIAKETTERNYFIREQLGRNFGDERKSALHQFKIIKENNSICEMYFTARNCWDEFLNVFPFVDRFNLC